MAKNPIFESEKKFELSNLKKIRIESQDSKAF